MRFLATAYTDVGKTKKVNQDAFCIKTAKTPRGNIAFAVMCDGMGGLNNGELASAFVVNAFSNWFENELPLMMNGTIDLKVISARWNAIIQEQGKKILDYGAQRAISLGTTLTAVLIIENDFICAHVGDSRLYLIDNAMHQLTKDQTVAAMEIEQKRMTVEEAKNDRRSSILLQCIGASKVIVPEIFVGKIAVENAMMLCSDGFRHHISEEEMYGVMAPSVLTSEKVMKNSLIDLVELDKQRNERDNITALLIKTIN